jgi:hypothetical protein
MNNTTVVLEILLIGFQVVIWFTFVVLTVFGYSWIRLDFLKEWSAQISASIVGVAYMLGIVFDRVSSELGDRGRIGRFRTTRPPTSAKVRTYQQMEILTNNPEVYEYLDKRMNQHRLLRSTVFNLVLISITSLVFSIARLRVSWRLVIFISIFSAVMIKLALFTWDNSSRTLEREFEGVRKAMRGESSLQQDDLTPPSQPTLNKKA